MLEKIKVEMYRFTPTVTKEPWYQTYEVPFIQGSSVTNILDYIRNNIDSTIAYQSHTACNRGLCGRCALIINGKASLPCTTTVTGDLKIEPPKHAKIIRDLVYKLEHEQ